jgi:hypothetical protein
MQGAVELASRPAVNRLLRVRAGGVRRLPMLHLQEKLANLGGAFLPNGGWCPWRSRAEEELTAFGIGAFESS